jgi:hypothetical protein
MYGWIKITVGIDHTKDTADKPKASLNEENAKPEA